MKLNNSVLVDQKRNSKSSKFLRVSASAWSFRSFKHLKRLKERVIESFLFFCALFSVFVTAGIIGTLLVESIPFFQSVPIGEFLTGTRWTPLFADPQYGILPLLAGTLVTTGVALMLAIPAGTIIAIYLSEYANRRVAELIKPLLELLSAVPTVVYGYFALLFVIPLLQKFIPNLPGFNMLGAGIVMGIMIIPYVSSLSEDAMTAVPMHMREGSYALGATPLQTSVKVIFPSALSGITASYILGVSRAIGETMVVAIAAGMQANLTANPMQPAQTITAYIVQVSLGDLPHGSIGYQTIFVSGLTLMVMTFSFNIGGHFLRKKFQEVYS